MTPRSFFVNAFFGNPRRFCCWREFAPPRSSGQVSKATHGVMAMRAPSGHLIGFLLGLTFMMPPPEIKLDYSCHSSIEFPTVSNKCVSGRKQHPHIEIRNGRGLCPYANNLCSDSVLSSQVLALD